MQNFPITNYSRRYSAGGNVWEIWVPKVGAIPVGNVKPATDQAAREIALANPFAASKIKQVYGA